MNIFDVIGPIMIGPSSSHTAGAVRLGRMARTLLGEPPCEAVIGLHGSFASTGRGHGTDRALIAGLLGWRADDASLPHSFEAAAQNGLAFRFETVNLGAEAHPNSVVFELKGKTGGQLQTCGCSIGGGRIKITEINAFPLELTGEFASLITVHHDRPGVIHAVTGVLASHAVNIAEMRVSRSKKGLLAAMVIETDSEIPAQMVEAVAALPQIVSVRSLLPIID